MFLLLGFAFLSGLVTILAPCIWPLLPIVLSSSVAGGHTSHKRPLGVVLGVCLSFAIFTLALSSIVRIFNFDANVLRIISVVVIALLGVAMIIPGFNTVLEILIGKLSGRFNVTQTGQSTPTASGQAADFGPGFISGLFLGIVWSPCAGPILAAIAALAATGQVSFQVVLVTLAYVTGVGIPLFIFASAGQRIFNKSRKLSPYTGRIQQVFGVIMILTAILIYTNKAQDFQLALVDKFPILNSVLNGFESNSAVTEGLNKLRGSNTTSSNSSELFNANQPAPDFAGVTKWLNPESPLTMQSLRGKVVLVDFWTYTCINCLRTLPHVTSWYDKYKDQGLVVVGVHTPEFEFEKNTDNVLGAIKRFGIHYPVAQDNDYMTWNAYNNSYWPAEYLIDAKGVIRRTHFGEGEYDQMELAIQTLLKENGQKVTSKLDSMSDQTPTIQTSPETYLGSERMAYLQGSGRTNNGKQTFPLNSPVDVDQFAFGGGWNIGSEYSTTGDNASITYHFQAGHVYLVMRPGSAKSGTVKVILDGKQISVDASGQDVKNGIVTVDTDRLYDLVDLKGATEEHILRLEFQVPGIEVFAFTFG